MKWKELRHLYWFQIEKNPWSPWFIEKYINDIRVKRCLVCYMGQNYVLSLQLLIVNFVASELKDPIWHSLDWQIGSFSSEATTCIFYLFQPGITNAISTLNVEKYSSIYEKLSSPKFNYFNNWASNVRLMSTRCRIRWININSTLSTTN